jgi:hypothetical protein
MVRPIACRLCGQCRQQQHIGLAQAALAPEGVVGPAPAGSSSAARPDRSQSDAAPRARRTSRCRVRRPSSASITSSCRSFQRHHQLHGQRAHGHPTIHRQHGKGARQAGASSPRSRRCRRSMAVRATPSSACGCIDQYALERSSIESQQLAVTQRADHAFACLATQQADLADAFTGARPDAATRWGCRTRQGCRFSPDTARRPVRLV